MKDNYLRVLKGKGKGELAEGKGRTQRGPRYKGWDGGGWRGKLERKEREG